ncbi:phytanoyl-CoA dioxygenase family protein [Dongia deserti]|uniref:phytanoyl-CoA dioxygenase family protein n=1 Tax=Dongia deserti TaxID=2268030 RepID=UPI000E659E34|nr:phytanoyl-CoA dioxygenase family protein [Dongia deserti]
MEQAQRIWISDADCRLEDFRRLVERHARLADYPMANAVHSNVLTYEGTDIRRAAAEPESRKALMGEWARALMDGPGILLFRDAFPDPAVVDAASDRFFTMIAEQRASRDNAGDHFAKPGANDRIWNALEKLCLRDPHLFARYYGNMPIALASEAWLGPGYQITSQINVVNPGGEAQQPHRDYHMGFQTADVLAQFPMHAHRLSPVLTLQGAVAHCDMPVETGPTLYLPYSQTYELGYLAWRRPEFIEYFRRHRIQLPLHKGDAVFFNPALFHAAGSNRTTDVKRIANLLQVSSAYGRAMESVDRTRMSQALYPALLATRDDGELSPEECANAVAACAEGYSFPTNLDRDPPLYGLAPETQAQLMLRALAEEWSSNAFNEALEEQAWRRLA